MQFAGSMGDGVFGDGDFDNGRAGTLGNINEFSDDGFSGMKMNCLKFN